MNLKLIFFALAVFFFLLAGLNYQFNQNAVKTSIGWQWFAAACLTIALWIV